jgi:hypothetical protein
MSEELQDHGITYDGGAEQEAPETPAEEAVDNTSDDVAELAPAKAEEPSNNTEEQEPVTGSVDGVDVEGPEGFKKAINKKHFQAKEAERKAEELQRKLDELEAKHAEPAPVAVDVPSIPDQFDDDYQAAIKRREDAIQHNATVAAQEAFAVQERAKLERQQQNEKAKRIQKVEQDFNANGVKLGCNPANLQEASNVVAGYGVNGEVANYLLSDPDGPLMVLHLAANPLDIETINNLGSVEAGIYLASELKGKINKPKTSSAPKPATVLSGSGVATASAGPEGATYE